MLIIQIYLSVTNISIYDQKFIHPHRIQEVGQGNNMDYAVHRPILPHLLSLVNMTALLGDWQ